MKILPNENFLLVKNLTAENTVFVDKRDKCSYFQIQIL